MPPTLNGYLEQRQPPPRNEQDEVGAIQGRGCAAVELLDPNINIWPILGRIPRHFETN